MADYVQTTITSEPAVGMAGMPYDSGPYDVISCVAQEAIPFGAYVRVSGQYCELPDNSGEVTAGEGGVALRVATRVQGVGHVAGDLVPVMRQGRVWVETEEAIAAQANPFIRFGGSGNKGAFRNDADTSNAVQPAGISVFRGTAAAGLAALQLNYPGTGTELVGPTGPTGPTGA